MNGNGTTPERFIAVPAETRAEIGELAYYLAQALHSLQEVNENLRGSSQTVPGVLHDLLDVLRMTEDATVHVLEQTEALVEEGRTVVDLLDQARRRMVATAHEPGHPLAQIGSLVARSNERAMSIMSALEFQDLTAQKMHRVFGVLEEVLVRIGRIQALMDFSRLPGEASAPAPSPGPATPAAPPPRPGEAQALADELLRGWSA